MKTYTKPNALVINFVSEDIITSSGVTTNPLTALAKVNFTNSQANVSWNDKVVK